MLCVSKGKPPKTFSFRNWLAHLDVYRFPLALLGACILAYGLLASSLGFYWDGWPFAWIAETFGHAGLARYFSTNRPVWAWLFQLTTPLFGTSSFAWQIFGLIARWASGLAFWLLLKRLWPRQTEAAAWAALLFALYPGFGQSSIANMYVHFYIVLTLVLVSLWLHLGVVQPSGKRSTRQFTPTKIYSDRKALATIFISFCLSAYALFANEYFFGLELMRPILLFVALPTGPLKVRLRRVLGVGWPFGLLILVYAYWRIFILGFHTYDPLAIASANSLSHTPVTLSARFVGDIFLSGIAAWGVPLAKFLQADWESRFTWTAGIMFSMMAFGLYIVLRKREKNEIAFGKQTVFLSLALLALSGLPVWAIGLPIRFTFPNDRLTLPMMSGAALLIIGLGHLLFRSPIARRGIFAGLASLAIACQFLNGAEYRQDWKYQQSLFWQLTWRAPAIQPGTILIMNEQDELHLTDNSLVAPLNWLYAPGVASSRLEYYAAYVPLRTQPGSLLDPLAAGKQIKSNYLVANFEGSTDHALVVLFDPPRCLRILDPVYDFGYPQLPDGLKEALPLSNPQGLINANAVIHPDPVFGLEPSRDTWCYYFERADLARQQKDWASVAELGDAGFSDEESPNHATERLPFIEGYAMVGRWQAAEDLTRQTLEINRFTAPMLCSLWQRVKENTQMRDTETVEAMLLLTCGLPTN